MPSGQIAGDLIRDAMRLIGVLGTGEEMTAPEANDGLVKLNDLLEIWSTQNLALYGSADQTFNTVAGTATYTIGPTGTWITDRPVRINASPYCTLNGVDFPILLVGQAQFDLTEDKAQPGQLIERMLYVNDHPNGIITLWPVPSDVIPITMSIDRVLAQVPTLATVMSFPPGYLIAFKYGLAILLAPDYGRQVPAEVAAIATSTMATIKRANKVRRVASYDAALLGNRALVGERW